MINYIKRSLYIDDLLNYATMVRNQAITIMDYVIFLMTSPVLFTCTSASETNPPIIKSGSHDSYNRFLNMEILNPDILYKLGIAFIDLNGGYLIIDDTLLLKKYAKHIDLAKPQYSGKEHRVFNGICLVTLLWTDGVIRIPVDYRIYNKDVDGKTKNDHFRDMMETAYLRGFNPKAVFFDSWFAGLKNIQLLTSYNWKYFSRLKSNRLIRVEDSSFQQVKNTPIDQQGTIVTVKNLGLVKCFKTRNKRETDRFWFTNILEMDITTRKEYQKICWKIEQYHRDIKGCCGSEKCQCRSACAQLNHILCSLCAFIHFEVKRSKSEGTCYQAKRRFVSSAVRQSRMDLSMRDYLLEGLPA